MYAGFQGDSERKIACVYSGDYEPESWYFPIDILVSKLEKDSDLNHRDFLGAIMNLKIKRDYIGDIIVEDGVCYIACHRNMSQLIIDELTQVGNSSVKFSIYTGELNYTRKVSLQKTVTVASYRLDRVIGAVLNISRSDSAVMIKSGLVSVNHLMTKKPDFETENGDVLSIRHYGKYKLICDGNKSRKDRFFITYLKY
mgnify:FL=1